MSELRAEGSGVVWIGYAVRYCGVFYSSEAQSFLLFLESKYFPWSIGVLEELFSKNLCKIIFFMAYSPKMARIDKNGQKVRLKKLKDEFSA